MKKEREIEVRQRQKNGRKCDRGHAKAKYSELLNCFFFHFSKKKNQSKNNDQKWKTIDSGFFFLKKNSKKKT